MQPFVDLPGNSGVLFFNGLTNHAVHIELVSSMDKSSRVTSIERFISRRGEPSMNWSALTMVLAL